MNGIQGGGPSGRQLNQLFDDVVTIIKYKKITIYRSIYIKVFSDVKMPCLTVSGNHVFNATNNET